MRYYVGLVSILLAAACADSKSPIAPTRPAADIAPLAPQKLTTTSYNFENQTGQVVDKLVVIFGSTIGSVPWAPFPYTTNDETLELTGIGLPTGKHVQFTAAIQAKNPRVAAWYWKASDGTPIGATNKGCSTRDGCGEIAAPNVLDLRTPVLTLLGNQEIAYCFYFRTPNQASTVLQSIRSHLPASVLRVNLILTNREYKPAGTLSAFDCGPVLGVLADATVRSWVYTAYTADNEFAFPANDGTGKPLGLVLAPGTYGYLYVLFSNPLGVSAPSYVELSGTEYPAGTAATPANTFVTFNNSISIPTGYTESSMTCTVPAGAKFFWMSTFAHPQMEHAIVWDGLDVVFESFDPKNPGFRQWGPPFFSFSSGQLRQRFDYLNLTNRTITTGPSYFTDEEGVVLSWFFPATASKLCFDGFGPL